MLLGDVGQRTVRNGILRPPAGKDIGIVGRELVECCSAIGVDGDAIGASIVSIGAHVADQASLEYGLLIQH